VAVLLADILDTNHGYARPEESFSGALCHGSGVLSQLFGRRCEIDSELTFKGDNFRSAYLPYGRETFAGRRILPSRSFKQHGFQQDRRLIGSPALPRGWKSLYSLSSVSAEFYR
jgi:hypothetical protein